MKDQMYGVNVPHEWARSVNNQLEAIGIQQRLIDAKYTQLLSHLKLREKYVEPIPAVPGYWTFEAAE